MTLVYFLIVIGILVFVHEFGHFIMAKRAGVRVEKFSLGMGPKLFGYQEGRHGVCSSRRSRSAGT